MQFCNNFVTIFFNSIYVESCYYGIMKDKLFVGVDVGGTKILAALVEQDGEVVARHKLATPPNASSKEVISTIQKCIEELFAEEEIKTSDIDGIGLGVPGIVDESINEVVNAPNIKLAGAPLVPELEKKFGVKIALGNDVNMGVLGEKWLGAGREAMDVVGMFMGTGLGGGIVIGGKMLAGFKGYAAEIGHMIMQVDGPKCTCGNSGCLEAFVGRWAIERDIRQAIKNSEKTIISQLTDGKVENIKSKALKEAVEKNDEVVTRIMENVSRVMGFACISLRHIFDPELIILGGGVMEACGDFILPIVKKVVKSDPYFPEMKEFKIVESHLGDDAVFLGAVAYIQQRLGMNPFAPAVKTTVELTKDGSLIVNGEKQTGGVFVRADGKIDDGNRISRVIKGESDIGIKEAKKLCKKNPELIIVAIDKKKQVKIDDEAKAFLKDSNVEIKFVEMNEAIELYAKTPKRKALLVLA